jgi:hypothetical protein
MARDVISRTKKGWVGAGAVLQAGRIKISDGRWHRYGLLAVMLVCGGLLIRVGHDFFAPIQIAEARLQIPSQPVTKQEFDEWLNPRGDALPLMPCPLPDGK